MKESMAEINLRNILDEKLTSNDRFLVKNLSKKDFKDRIKTTSDVAYAFSGKTNKVYADPKIATAYGKHSAHAYNLSKIGDRAKNIQTLKKGTALAKSILGKKNESIIDEKHTTRSKGEQELRQMAAQGLIKSKDDLTLTPKGNVKTASSLGRKVKLYLTQPGATPPPERMRRFAKNSATSALDVLGRKKYNESIIDEDKNRLYREFKKTMKGRESMKVDSTKAAADTTKQKQKDMEKSATKK